MNTTDYIHNEKQKKRFSEAQQQVSRLDQAYRMKISDKYHSFGELYEHRYRLWITLCKMIKDRDECLIFSGKIKEEERTPVWCSKLHSNGDGYKGWFILGVGEKAGTQMTYHFPDRFWQEITDFAQVLDFAPEFDGHSAADTLERMKNPML